MSKSELTPAQAHLERMRSRGVIGAQQQGFALDYVDGDPEFEYAWVVFGPKQAAEETHLLTLGYEIAPAADTVRMLLCGGMTRVQRSPAAPLEYAVFRIPMDGLKEQLLAAERARGIKLSLSQRKPVGFDEEYAEAEERMRHLGRLTGRNPSA